MNLWQTLESKLGSDLYWILGSVVTLLLVILFAVWLIRKYFRPDSKMEKNLAFSLDGLEKMYKDGHISDDEYKTLKGKLVQQMDLK